MVRLATFLGAQAFRRDDMVAALECILVGDVACDGVANKFITWLKNLRATPELTAGLTDEEFVKGFCNDTPIYYTHAEGMYVSVAGFTNMIRRECERFRQMMERTTSGETRERLLAFQRECEKEVLDVVQAEVRTG